MLKQPEPDPDPENTNTRSASPSQTTSSTTRLVETLGDSRSDGGGVDVTSHRTNGAPYQAIVALYNEVLVPPLPRVTRLSQGRRDRITARWRDELPELENWRNYFEYVKNHTKLPKGWAFEGRLWRPDFDWLVNPTNLLKVEEHKYDR
jgi:hypothetical protein